MAASLPFILGRVVDISTRLEHQLESYTEVTIWGDLSESDIAAADSQLDAFTVSTLSYIFASTLASQNPGLRAHMDLSLVHGSILSANRCTDEVRR